MSDQSLEYLFKNAEHDVVCLTKLLKYGRTKGFESFLNRKSIWPFLLKVDTSTMSGSRFDWDGQMNRNSQDYEQLQKDAERSLSSMKTFEDITKFHLQKRQKDVLKILDSFFAKNTHLKYIQGFHDVASIFLVLFGNNQGYYLMEKAGKTYFRDFLTKDIGTLGNLISDMVLSLLCQKDKQFEQIFECFRQVNLIIFIIPWVLTWFAHVFSSVKTTCRIWDYLLCTGPHGIIYLTAGIIMATKTELIAECAQFDQASIHTFYQERAKNQSIDIEESIRQAMKLQETIPLQSLQVYDKLSPESMFRSVNFEHHIDYHRRVKEHLKIEAEKARQRKIWVTVGITFAVSATLAYAYRKKLPWL